jgi:hypothetical protein
MCQQALQRKTGVSGTTSSRSYLVGSLDRFVWNTGQEEREREREKKKGGERERETEKQGGGERERDKRDLVPVDSHYPRQPRVLQGMAPHGFLQLCDGVAVAKIHVVGAFPSVHNVDVGIHQAWQDHSVSRLDNSLVQRLIYHLLRNGQQLRDPSVVIYREISKRNKLARYDPLNILFPVLIFQLHIAAAVLIPLPNITILNQKLPTMLREKLTGRWSEFCGVVILLAIIVSIVIPRGGSVRNFSVSLPTEKIQEIHSRDKDYRKRCVYRLSTGCKIVPEETKPI